MILFIKHIEIEGPDMLESFFRQRNFETRIIELQNNDPLPKDFNNIEAVISLGGPMNVYEEGKYPFLKGENRFVKEILSKEIPFVGICLGSQILAKACGAKIKKSPEREIGFYPVEIKQEGLADKLFEGVDEVLDVFHWHEDMSELPSEAIWLASSKGCPHQAFKIGPCAYGLQFHIEVTWPTIEKWTEAYFDNTDENQAPQKQKILEDYLRKNEEFRKITGTINSNFLNIINRSKHTIGA